MLHTQTNSQVLSADGETLVRLVTINGIPCWETQTGRTFPVIAGAEDGEGDGNTEENGEAEQDSADNYDKERGFRKIQAQAADLKKLKAERDVLRAQARELEALKAKEQERADADKSELEKAQLKLAAAEKAHEEAQAKLRKTLVIQAIERAAIKQNARDPEVVAKLIDYDALEFDDDGTPSNAEHLVKDLLRDKTYLVGGDDGGHNGSSRSGVPPTPRSSGAPKREDKVKENEEKLIATRQYNPIG